MQKFTMLYISTVVHQLMTEIVPLIDSDKRSYDTNIEGFKFHVGFTDVVDDSGISQVRIDLYLNGSKLTSLTCNSKMTEQFKPSLKSAIYYNLVSKMFRSKLQDLSDLLIKKIETSRQEVIDIAFGHWVKLEIDPRARSGMRMSYGDGEGTLMSTPVDDPGQSVQYVISSLRGRSEAVPYVVDQDKAIEIDLENFKWG